MWGYSPLGRRRSRISSCRFSFTERVSMPNPEGLTVREFLAAALGVVPAAIDNSTRLQVGGATIEIRFGSEGFDLPRQALIGWVLKAAKAVASYYGVFPVPFTRVHVNSSEKHDGVFGGTTWGSNPPFTRIFVGRHTTSRQLDEDWMMTHEFVHLAFPDVADEHHWIEEGIATYVEPIARVQIGDLAPKKIWADMLHGMPKGEPEPFDKGLDHTHTWGRTYWGGALFCLLADVQIRQATNNQQGLQNALRGIREAGGTIDNSWPLEKALKTGDKASQTKVLTSLYTEMKDQPVYVDLKTLWHELGVNSSDDVISFNETAPLAQIRRSITSTKASDLILRSIRTQK